MSAHEDGELHRIAKKNRGTRHAVDGGKPAFRLDRKSSGGRLTAAERHALPSKDFALPGERYPIEDKNHARNALARVSQYGSSAEKARVRAKVHSKFPAIGDR